jgi:hypothetical protein
MVLSLYYNHWVKSGGEQYYTIKMLKGGLYAEKLIENTPTIFIQRNRDTGKIDGCWEGSVHSFVFTKDEKGRDAVRFHYTVKTEIDCPPEYATFSPGWYQIEEASSPPQRRFDPPFVEDLITTQDWQVFETRVYWLLKLLGIHNLYLFDKGNQPGRPDGFFKLGRSAIIYDATLNRDFIADKKEQINNYCSQLKTGFLDYDGGTVDVRESEKQVWLVTKGKTHTIRKVDDIVIREVSVQDLMDLNEKRIVDNLDEDQLAYELKIIGH